MANISVDITGNDKSASSAMDSVGSKASSFSEKLKSMGRGVGSVFGGLELQELGDKVVEFAKSSTEKLEEVASETRNLQRVMGGSSETVSEFAAVSNKLGVNQSALVVSMQNASKAIVNGTSVLPKLGIAVKDADGNYRSMSDLMPEIAEKFANTKNSTERAAMAADIFGKSGRMLLPVLAQGRDGLADMEEEAKKTGLSLSGQAMTSTWKFQQSQIALKESVEGLQIKMGTALYPQLIKLSNVITTKVLPAVMVFFNWMSKNPALISTIARVIGPLVAGILLVIGAIKVWTVVQGLLDVVLDANPIGLIILAVGALIAAVLLIVANWKVIGPWLANLWTSILSFLTGVWNSIVSFLQGAITRGLQIFENFTPLGIIVSHFGQVESFFSGFGGRIIAAIGNIEGRMMSVGVSIVRGIISGITSMVGAAGNAIGGVMNEISSFLPHSPAKKGPLSGRGWTTFSGAATVQGWIDGVASKTGAAQKAMSGVVKTPTLQSMGVAGSSLSGPASTVVNEQAARAAGGVYIGQINGASMSPAQVMQEAGWFGRWAT